MVFTLVQLVPTAVASSNVKQIQNLSLCLSSSIIRRNRLQAKDKALKPRQQNLVGDWDKEKRQPVTLPSHRPQPPPLPTTDTPEADAQRLTPLSAAKDAWWPCPACVRRSWKVGARLSDNVNPIPPSPPSSANCQRAPSTPPPSPSLGCRDSNVVAH